MLAYTYKGIQNVTNQNVDPINKTYFIEHAETSSEQVIVDQDQNIRLNEVLNDLETRIAGDSMLPSQVGNSGKFLSTNGSTLKWELVDALPSQTNNAGKALYTNGDSAYWAVPLQLTSTVYPTVSNNSIGSYGASTEAARADHKHPLPVYFLESYSTAIGGETELYLTEQQYPSGDRPVGFHLYRNGLLLTPDVDYTLDSVNKKITFQKACEAKENIIIVLGYLQGYNSPQTEANISSILNQILTTEDVPLMDGEVAIGNSSKAANALHRHPTDTTRAPIFSPNFTGTPTIVNPPSLNDNSNKIATTSFVMNQLDQYNSDIIPDQTDKAGFVLSTDGESLRWIQNIEASNNTGIELPSYSTDNAGDVLSINEDGDLYWTEPSTPTELIDTTDAETNDVLSIDQDNRLTWRSILEIPSLSALTENKVLSNDGSTLTWVSINANTSNVTSSITPLDNASEAYIGDSTESARADHVHKSDDSKANIDSPEFTGTPTSPTPSLNDNSNKIATTEFVNSKISSSVNEALNNIDYNNDIFNSESLITLTNVVEKLQDFGNLDDSINEVTIDFSSGNAVQLMVKHDVKINFTISSEPNSNFREVTIILYSLYENIVEWPENIRWDIVHAPTLDTSLTILKLITFNNGSSWYGSVFGKY